MQILRGKGALLQPRDLGKEPHNPHVRFKIKRHVLIRAGDERAKPIVDARKTDLWCDNGFVERISTGNIITAAALDSSCIGTINYPDFGNDDVISRVAWVGGS